MARSVTALYETRARAEAARDQLKAAHLGDHVDIHDAESGGARDQRDVVDWLGGLFDGRRDHHVFAEALRRGHVLLTAKVDDFSEIRAAEILDASPSVDLGAAEAAWSAEGWSAPMKSSEGEAPAYLCARIYEMSD